VEASETGECEATHGDPRCQSRLIIERIGAILSDWKKRGRHFPASHMGKVVDCTLTLWHGLRVFVEDGRIEIDNNEVENAIRPPPWVRRTGSSSATLKRVNAAPSCSP
jgi:hypothetical protein